MPTDSVGVFTWEQGHNLESVQLWFDRLDSVISETENKRAVAAVQKPTEREVAKPVQQPAVLGKLSQPTELVAEQEVVENRDVQPAVLKKRVTQCRSIRVLWRKLRDTIFTRSLIAKRKRLERVRNLVILNSCLKRTASR